MAYTVISPQPANLQPHEVAVNLTDIHTDAAVFVEVSWQTNNVGAVFHAIARAIDAGGNQQICPAGNPITTEARHLCCQPDIAIYGAPALQKEIAQLVMGEPPTMVTATNPDGTTFQRQLIDVSADVMLNWSIRHAVAVASQAGPVTNLAAML